MQHRVFYLRLSKHILVIHSPSLQHCLGLLSFSCCSQENKSKERQPKFTGENNGRMGIKNSGGLNLCSLFLECYYFHFPLIYYLMS